MKEATGELSMTVVTIIAVIVIAAIVAALRKPIITYINNQWSKLTGDSSTKISETTGSNANKKGGDIVTNK